MDSEGSDGDFILGILAFSLGIVGKEVRDYVFCSGRLGHDISSK